MPTSKPHNGAASSCPYAAIVAGVGEAWMAAKEGRHHPRHMSLLERRGKAETARMAKEAAHYPELPQIIVTTPFDHEKAYSDFINRRYGLGGSERQE